MLELLGGSAALELTAAIDDCDDELGGIKTELLETTTVSLLVATEDDVVSPVHADNNAALATAVASAARLVNKICIFFSPFIVMW